LPDGSGVHQKINGIYFFVMQVIYTQEVLKMDLNMDKEANTLDPKLIRVNTLMAFLKVMVSINGKMGHIIKETSNKV